jgi:hypothetical protein
VLAGEEAPGDAGPLVEALERHHADVRGELEHGIAARVEDGPAGPEVLRAEFLDDVRAAGRAVPQDLAADGALERFDDLRREAVRIRRERLVGHDPGELPVAGRGVLPGRALSEDALRRPGKRLRRKAFHVRDQPKAERLEVRGVQATHRRRDVADGVGILVSVLRGVGSVADPPRVADDEQDLLESLRRHVAAASPARRRLARGCARKYSSRRRSPVTIV